MKRRVRLTAPGFLGDEVVLTGVVREIVRANPGLEVSIATGRPELWQGNPNIAEVNVGADLPQDGEEVFADHFGPEWRRYNQVPVHYLQAYLQNVATALRVEAVVTQFRGDVYADPTWEHPRLPDRFWIVVPGCKPNVPVKGWGTPNYQAVVEALWGRLSFVQVGLRPDWSPALDGVVNLVGKLRIRDLVNLMHRAEGVLCPITSLMHLAAAVPVDRTRSKFLLRPCVVVAGGREPPHFITYPGHRVLHNVGSLECCREGGCGKSAFATPDHKGGCRFPVAAGAAQIPKCMAAITPAQVVQAIESYYAGGLMGLPRRIERAQMILRRLRSLRAKGANPIGAEIGVNRGLMSAALLRGREDLRLIMVDPWVRQPEEEERGCTADPRFYRREQPDFDRAFKQAMENTDFASARRDVRREFSVQAAALIEDRSLDFVFIDACHSYEGCKSDLEAWAPKLKSDGLLCGHDYHRPKFPLEGVKRAVDEFSLREGRKVATDGDNTWFIEQKEAAT